MNKTININLSGHAFQIEELAYNKLDNYLNTIKSRLGKTEDASEIIEDIETHIAELFRNKHGIQQQVITLQLVEEIIATIGEPKDIVDDEAEETDSEKQQSHGKVYSGKKRLYRDPENKIIGGVCGGIGSYFNIDPLIIRVLAVIITLTTGFGLLAYIVLLIAMPKAVTISQRMEMQGGYSFKDLEDNLKKEYQRASEKFGNFKKSESYQNMNKSFSSSGNILGFILGLILIVWSLLAIISISGIILAKDTIINLFDITNLGYISTLPNLFINTQDQSQMYLATFIIIGIPLLVVFYYGIKLMFNIRSRNRFLGVLTFLTWIGGIGLVFYSVFNVANDFKEKASIEEEIRMPDINYTTLYVKANHNSKSLYHYNYLMEINQLTILRNTDDLVVEGEPRINISQSPRPMISLTRHANGETDYAAEYNMHDILYEVHLQDSILTLDEVFSLRHEALIRNQKVDINISLPEHVNVEVDPELRHLLTNY